MPDKKFDEDALRKKIREQLEKEHSEKKEFTDSQLSKNEIASHDEDESYFLEIYIRNNLEDEVYSKFPEFVECGNHLEQVKWLTPLELSEEYEFFPIEYTFWARIKNKFINRKKIKVPDNPEIKKMIAEFREEIENNAKIRIQKYNEYLKKHEISYRSDKEKGILEEEKERFYSSLKGYKKYKNHIGETFWMTEKEFDDQDEFIDRVYTTKDKIKNSFLYSTVGILLIVGVSLVMNFFDEGARHGYVLIDISNNKASLYIDQNLAIGFTPGSPYPLNVGVHDIALISAEFKTDPNFHTVEITKGDTTKIDFELTLIKGSMGVVRINAPYKDAVVYADGEFKGTIQNSKVLNLAVGDHSVTLKKPNYITNPRVHTFVLNAGDTIDIDFRMTQLKTSEDVPARSSTLNLGLIEINSNVRDAKIYLNGHNTGFTTDYILQKIPFGQHLIRLEKEGFKVYPDEQVVILSQNERQAKVDFTLTSTTRFVTISVKPRNAEIFIDGKGVAQGTFKGSLSLGEHDIRFSNLENYKNPGEQKINITAAGDDRFEFLYGSDIYYEISPSIVKPSSLIVRTSSGYILKGINFKANSTNGPEIITNKTVNESVWNLGFAFQYKNPPGSDAIYVRFEVPSDLNIADDVKLKMWLYKTDDKYPLAISNTSEYMVVFNNRVIVESRSPRYNLSEISEQNYEEVSITNLVKPGVNILIIAAGPNNTKFLNLWKLVVN